MIRFAWMFAAVAAMGAMIAACSDDDPSGPRAGDVCSSEGEEACSGALLLECRSVDGALHWTLDNDCAAKGEQCVIESDGNGKCDG